MKGERNLKVSACYAVLQEEIVKYRIRARKGGKGFEARYEGLEKTDMPGYRARVREVILHNIHISTSSRQLSNNTLNELLRRLKRKRTSMFKMVSTFLTQVRTLWTLQSL